MYQFGNESIYNKCNYAMIEVIGQFPARSIEFPDQTQSINNFEW